jgi:hypothetical protein
MQLPFTTDQFFDVFAAYNEALSPALIALWIASVVASLRLRSSRALSDRWITALLAAHWAWSGLAYHAAFFTVINPAAWIFAALFLMQAALFVWVGIVQRRLSFAATHNGWTMIAWILVAYSLVYPAINAIQHFSISRIPAFGVPCPTTIFTAGLLMLAAPRSRVLAIIPIVWSLVAGSAAVILDVRADYALPIAATLLAIFSLQGSERRRSVGGNVRMPGPHRGRNSSAPPMATSISASAPPVITRKRGAPRKTASPSFIAVFARTPTAMAVAATAGESVAATARAIDTVRASTSVRPSTAADVNTPDCPHTLPTRRTAISTA